MVKIVVFITVIAVLSGVGFFLTLSPKLRKKRESNNLFYEFMLTLLATFLGAFIALMVTNIDIEISEKQKMTKMLQLSIDDMESIQRNLGIYYTDIVDKKKPYGVAEHIKNNNIPYSNIFEQFLTNDIIVNRMTAETYANLVNGSKNAKKQLDYLNDETLDNDKAMLYVGLYGKELDYLIKVMYTEISYCKGEISLKRMIEIQEALQYELIGVTPEKINEAIKEQSN